MHRRPLLAGCQACAAKPPEARSGEISPEGEPSQDHNVAVTAYPHASEIFQDVWKYYSGPAKKQAHLHIEVGHSQTTVSATQTLVFFFEPPLTRCTLKITVAGASVLSLRSTLMERATLRVSTEKDLFKLAFLHLCCFSLCAAPYGCALIFSASILCSREMTFSRVPRMVSFFVFVVIGR